MLEGTSHRTRHKDGVPREDEVWHTSHIPEDTGAEKETFSVYPVEINPKGQQGCPPMMIHEEPLGQFNPTAILAQENVS